MMWFMCLFLCAVSVGAVTNWSDCSDPSDNTTLLTFHAFNIKPNPISLPGTVTFSINMTISGPIDYLVVDMGLYRHLPIGPFKIPCITEYTIGSCDNIDMCDLLTDIRYGVSSIEPTVGAEISEALEQAVGHIPGCPIPEEEVAVTDALFHLNGAPSGVMALLTQGNYTVKLNFKDGAKTSNSIGCLTFDGGLHAVEVDATEEEIVG